MPTQCWLCCFFNCSRCFCCLWIGTNWVQLHSGVKSIINNHRPHSWPTTKYIQSHGRSLGSVQLKRRNRRIMASLAGNQRIRTQSEEKRARRGDGRNTLIFRERSTQIHKLTVRSIKVDSSAIKRSVERGIQPYSRSYHTQKENEQSNDFPFVCGSHE